MTVKAWRGPPPPLTPAVDIGLTVAELRAHFADPPHLNTCAPEPPPPPGYHFR